MRATLRRGDRPRRARSGEIQPDAGGAADGARLNSIYRENAGEAEILETLDPIFAAYAKEREPGERFGDYTRRAGIV